MGASALFDPPMIPVELGTFLAAVAALGCAVPLAAWVWNDRRDARLDDPRRIRSSFACARCGRTYARARPQEEAPCPGCGTNNVRLRF